MTHPVPKRLIFFPPGSSVGHRRRRIIAATVLAVAILALCPPLYTYFSGIYPLILGLPLSLMWIVCWLLIVFTTIALVFHFDYKNERDPSQTGLQRPASEEKSIP